MTSALLQASHTQSLLKSFFFFFLENSVEEFLNSKFSVANNLFLQIFVLNPWH